MTTIKDIINDAIEEALKLAQEKEDGVYLEDDEKDQILFDATENIKERIVG